MEGKIYDHNELKLYSNQELVQCLKEHWKVETDTIEVWGEIKPLKDKSFGFLTNVRTFTSNTPLIYPLKGHEYYCDFFISSSDAQKFGNRNSPRLIRCELVLAPEAERKKHNIPFELNVLPGSCTPLEQLPDTVPIDIVSRDEKSFFISKTLYEYYHQKADKKINEEFETVRAEQEKSLYEIKNLRLSEESTRDNHIKTNRALANRKQALDNEIKNLNLQQKEELENLYSLKNQLVRLEVEMNNKIARLKSYVSEKASFLKTFEFVDEEDLDHFLLTPSAKSAPIDGIKFNEELEGNYQKAVSYIQAHLVDDDILYPRHIIENYLTLLRTKDLIILAGDSGSGKTNLVKSFAKAVGGKSIIIPVKPNWTSAEDLLGYYNPIERKYLPTPFLEALLEAEQNPDTPYFVCLDEMNLARVEYYFADFLSLLEARDEQPEITLYTDDESSHVLSELKAVVEIIQTGKEKYKQDGVINFIELLKDNELNNHLKQAFGFSDKDSLIKYHSEIRRMLSSVMSMPSKIKMPENVYIIGTINIDETTHYLSPKILDRAHIMRFESPLLSDWDEILSEVEDYEFGDISKPLLFSIEALGARINYPKFNREDEFCKLFVQLNRDFFHRLDIEFGMRTIRQGLYYQSLFNDVNDDPEMVINNFILHKILPKFTFDGNKNIGQQTKLDLIQKVLLERIKTILPEHEDIPDSFSVVSSIEKLVDNAKANDGVVNFWS